VRRGSRRGEDKGGLLFERFAGNATFLGAAPGSFKAWSVGLLAAVAVAAAMAQGAEASAGGWADSDGYVPVYSVCYSGTGAFAYYSYYSDGYGNVEGAVYVDDCLLADYGAGPYDRQSVIDHEMGHARGLPDSSDPNSYMYAYYTVTGT
jgi:hypothetical protein